MTFWQGVGTGVGGTILVALALAAFLRWIFSGVTA